VTVIVMIEIMPHLLYLFSPACLKKNLNFFQESLSLDIQVSSITCYLIRNPISVPFPALQYELRRISLGMIPPGQVSIHGMVFTVYASLDKLGIGLRHLEHSKYPLLSSSEVST